MKYAIITPVLNEVENLPKLFNSIKNQSLKPLIWIIIDNGSTDGSREMIMDYKDKWNIIQYLEYYDEIKEYKVGVKYSRIIDFGFTWLKRSNYFDEMQYLGILDADVFPEKEYYSKLIDSFLSNNQLGITSGICKDYDGNSDGELQNAVRGNCRLWTIDCFKECGYVIGPSADALSAAIAEIRGWEVYSTINAICYIRKMGERVNYQYYGYSMYYRGVDPFIAILKTLRIFNSHGIKKSYEFFRGYFISLIKRKNTLDDAELKKYFKTIPYKRILQVLNNKISD